MVPRVSALTQLKQGWSESMREVIGQTRYYRERGEVDGKEKVCWQKEKQLLTFVFLSLFRENQLQRVAGFPNTLLRSAPLSALSQQNG